MRISEIKPIISGLTQHELYCKQLKYDANSMKTFQT